MLSGVGEISRASTAPKDVKSGVAIALLQDQDDTRLAATVGSIEMCVIRRGKFWLRLYKKHVTFPRTLVSYGKNKAEDVIDWVGSDLKSDDVILDSMSAIVDSPAMRQQKINELLGTPLFLDEGGAIGKETKAKLFEMMQLGTWEDGNDTTQDQIDKQNRENRMMLAGNMPLAAEFDDHNLHISFLNKYRLSTDYEELIMENPQVSEFFQSHANQHMAYMVAQARQQAQAQMAQQQQQIMLSQQAAAVQAAGGSSK